MSREIPKSSFDQATRDALEKLDPQSRPNLRPLAAQLRDMRNAMLSVKFFGYELARTLADHLPQRTGLAPCHIPLNSKPSTQEDMESDWAAYWCEQLKIPIIFHRKIWEYVYFLQVLQNHSLIEPTRRGVGFGCGSEPLASFLASRQIQTLVTDVASDTPAGKVWSNSDQHTSSLQNAFHAHLVDQDLFNAMVTHRHVDMNDIPKDLEGFDFCWSICALEHLGSIAKGLDFIANSLNVLRPGGIAVHTTEFNFLDDTQTIDNWPTVLFQGAHFKALAKRLTDEGHSVAPIDLNVGSKPLDRFIDVPPYEHDWSETEHSQLGRSTPHLKLSIDGFATTCFGISIKKAG